MSSATSEVREVYSTAAKGAVKALVELAVESDHNQHWVDFKKEIAVQKARQLGPFEIKSATYSLPRLCGGEQRYSFSFARRWGGDGWQEVPCIQHNAFAVRSFSDQCLLWRLQCALWRMIKEEYEIV